MNFETADDQALVEAARDGDIAAFETLVRRHVRVVYAHALRFFGNQADAEDAVQEVFVKVFRSLDTYDGKARFSTWLYRVTRNTCLDEVRSGRRRPVPVDPLEVTVPTADFSEEVVWSHAIEMAMRSLPPQDRDALSAVSVFGLSYAEAGDALGIPAGTVKSRAFRARRALRAILDVPEGGA